MPRKQYDPGDFTNSAFLGLRIPEPEMFAIERQAAETKRSTSDVARELMRRGNLLSLADFYFDEYSQRGTSKDESDASDE